MSPAGEERIRLASAAGLLRRRRLAAGGFALALIALIASSVWYAAAKRAERASQVELATTASKVAEARLAMELRDRRRALAQALDTLAREARLRGLSPQHWSERRITLNEMRYDRPTANDVVVTTANGRGRVFDTEAFELSVLDPGESLFELPEGPGQPVRLTLRGTSIFSTRDAD